MALVSSRQRVLCRADAGAAQPMTLVNLISALAKASSAWEKYGEPGACGEMRRAGVLGLMWCAPAAGRWGVCWSGAGVRE